MEDGFDIQIQTEEATGSRTVRVKGELTLATAGRVQRVLLEGVGPGTKTVLDGGGITAVDLCGLQLVCSAHRTYLLNEACFEFRPIPGHVEQTARTAGYDASVSVCPYRRDGNCIWKG